LENPSRRGKPGQTQIRPQDMTKEKPVLMAKIGAAHGLKGEVRIKSFTGDPLALGDYGPLFDARGTMFEIAGLRPAKDMVVARFKSVTSREQAEQFNGTELFIDRSQLPHEKEDDEYYQSDLIGMRLTDENGTIYGAVESIHNYGAGDIIEVRRDRRHTFMIPFTKAAVTGIDLEGRMITIDPLAAGIVTTGDEDDSSEPGPDKAKAK
jgi:16S rRNA processing protein RimM